MLAIPELADKKSSLRMARLERATKKTTALRMKMERRRKAELERSNLMMKLGELWSTLEAGVPGVEKQQESHSSQEEEPHRDRKRKREPIRRDKITVKAEKSARKMGRELSSQLVEEVLLGMEIEHDCGISLACPAWFCETFTNRKEI